MYLGVVVLIVGIVLILKSLGFFSVFSWALFWGILLTAIGLKMILKRKHCVNCDWLGYHHKENKENQ